MKSATPTLPSRSGEFSVILFGLECVTTTTVLAYLLDAGIAVTLVCLPGRRSVPLLRTGQRRALPMAGQPGTPLTVTAAARTAGIELWRIGDIHAPEVQAAVAEVPAELVIVACYHRLLPAGLYTGRRFGGLNLHPSLLPDKRGPDPLFWVFRHDDQLVGSTVHQLTDSFDAGDILAQAAFPKPDGISETELDRRLARLGAEQTLQVIDNLRSGTLASRLQVHAAATWAPQPATDDYRLDRTFTARHAFNFFQGVKGRNQPITVVDAGHERVVSAVHGWTPGRAEPDEVQEGATALRFADGWLITTLAG